MLTLQRLAEAVAIAGPVLAREELDAVGVTRRDLRRALERGSLRRTRRGWYVVVGANAPDAELAEICRSLDAVISHESACVVHGIALAASPTEVHATVARSRGGLVRAGTRLHRRDLRRDEIAELRGVRVTSVVATLLDVARSSPLSHAVAAADSALHLRKTTKAELTAALAALPAGPGRRAVRAVVALADGRSESVLESLLRVLLVESGLAPPHLQWVVQHRGRRYRGDLAWPDLRVLVEADGFEFHSSRAAYRGDRRRGNGLALAGWLVLRFSWEDVVSDPGYVVEAVRDALGGRQTAPLSA